MERALSFGSAADAYERARPGYPRAAIEWLLGTAPRRVLDLAAGTGKLTRDLLAAGHEVVAVEPDPSMRAKLAETSPAADALAGRAEAIPLADASVDAVVVAQAYHWFDLPQALPEIARVLRPGGVLGVLWNLRDDNEPWVAEMSRQTAMTDSTSANAGEPLPDPGPDFDPIERATFHHSRRHDVESLLTLVSSQSFFIVAAPEQQAAWRAQLRRIVPARPTFELPYVTEAYRATRRAARPRPARAPGC